MTKQALLAKKDYYSKLKDELISKDFSVEIEEQVNEYRKKIVATFEEGRKEDLKKVDHYLELLSDLIDLEIKEDIENVTNHEEELQQ